MTNKVKVQCCVSFDTYAIIARAVEEGVAAGWRRAHKHTDTLDEATIKEYLEDEVMNALCEVMSFDGVYVASVREHDSKLCPDCQTIVDLEGKLDATGIKSVCPFCGKVFD